MRWIRFLACALISFLIIAGGSLLPADSTTVIAQRGSDNESPSIPLPDSGFPSPGGSFEDLFRTPGEQNERAAFERDFRRADVNRAVELFEQYQGKQFSKHLGLSSPARTPSVAEISQSL